MGGGELIRDGDLAIRRMRPQRADLELLVRWRNALHVREWWDPEPPLTLGAATEEYGPQTDPSSPTTACLVLLEGRPVGYVQFYAWSSSAEEARVMGVPADPGWWGLDVLIGEEELVGKGIGSLTVDRVCRYLFEHRGATGVALLTAVDNLRAQRAYEKAGLRKVRRTLDVDTRGGERVESWLMVRERAQRPG